MTDIGGSYGTDGPFIVWENYGYEGWRPKSYLSLQGAVTDTRYVSEWVITRRVDFAVTEAIGPAQMQIEQEKMQEAHDAL
jgi:hypothetical protein